MDILIVPGDTYLTSNTLVDISGWATDATQRSRSIPSARRGSQAYFWTTDWQQKEFLADMDFLVGDEYRPTDVDDLIRELND